MDWRIFFSDDIVLCIKGDNLEGKKQTIQAIIKGDNLENCIPARPSKIWVGFLPCTSYV